MNRLLSIFISIVGMIMVIIFSMNSVLFITHPSLSYGTEGMFHISIIFMLFSLGILFFLSKLNMNYIEESKDVDEHFLGLIFKHDLVMLNLISILILILYFIFNQIALVLPIFFVILFLLLLTGVWVIFIIFLYQKKEREKIMFLPNFISNIIFSAFTVYLFIELFLYVNLN